MNYEQLKFSINAFEKKMEFFENEYKEKNKENFDRGKMNKYVNRKLKKEIKGIILLNVYPASTLSSTGFARKFTSARECLLLHENYLFERRWKK